MTFFFIHKLLHKKKCALAKVSVLTDYKKLEGALAAIVTSPVLANLTSLLFTFGMFPSCIKKAKVILVNKSGNINEKNNFRPISLLSNISKIIEKSIKIRLLKFFDNDNLFFNCQCGFREKHSTSLALLNVVTQCPDNAHLKIRSLYYIKLEESF